MNKYQCKKYIKQAFKNMKVFNKTINVENLEIEMRRCIKEDAYEYVAYAKVAFETAKTSANEITGELVASELDEIKKLYSKNRIFEKALNIKG